MKIFLSHKSAVQFWRTYGKPDSSRPRFSQKMLPPTPPTIPDQRQLAYIGQSEPLNVLVASSNSRRASKVLTAHLFSGPLPTRCLVRISDGFYVSSPEFCFLQAASKLPLVKLIELGFELCGRYAKTDSATKSADATRTGKDPYNREQLTNTKKLSAFVGRLEGVAGKKRALQALQYIADGSASPRETVLVMFLTLPYRLGGYGLPMPELNYLIIPAKSGRQYAGKSSFSCDLYWPQVKLAVEYDSDEFHSRDEEKAEDSIRRNVLISMGVKVISVDNQHIKSRTQLEGVARQLSRNTSKRLHHRENPRFPEAQKRLREMLLQSSSPDFW